MKNNQKGFSAVEGLLILVIVGLIGFIGWYVWDKKQDDKKASDTPQTTQQSGEAEQRPAEETANWLSYQPTDKEFAVKLADGWELEQRAGGSTELFSNNNDQLALAAGKKAAVKVTSGPVEFYDATLFMKLEASTVPTTEYPVTETFQTASGLTVQEQYYLDPGNVSPGNFPKDTKIYNYFVTHKNRTFVVNYRVKPGQTDHHETVEKVIKTLELSY
jgi:hypothetical protein